MGAGGTDSGYIDRIQCSMQREGDSYDIEPTYFIIFPPGILSFGSVANTLFTTDLVNVVQCISDESVSIQELQLVGLVYPYMSRCDRIKSCWKYRHSMYGDIGSM